LLSDGSNHCLTVPVLNVHNDVTHIQTKAYIKLPRNRLLRNTPAIHSLAIFAQGQENKLKDQENEKLLYLNLQALSIKFWDKQHEGQTERYCEFYQEGRSTLPQLLSSDNGHQWSFRQDFVNLLKCNIYVLHQQVEHSRILFSAHTVFMCFVFIWEQTATSAPYIITDWDL